MIKQLQNVKRSSHWLTALCFTLVSSQAAADFKLDQPASFEGTLPCADCPGVAWHLDLWPEGRFHLRREYAERGQALDEIGRWRENPANRNSLLLFGGREAPIRLAATDTTTLRLLDQSGRAIESTLPYELTRLSSFTPTELKLRLVGEFRYAADSASVTACQTGTRYPVLMEAGYPKLEALYLANKGKSESSSELATPLLVHVDTEILNRQVMDGEGPAQSLLIARAQSNPDLRCEQVMESATLPNTYWRVDSLNGKTIETPEHGREMHLVMQDTDSRVAGHAGCNRFTGGYEVKGDTISFTPLASTMMACPEPMMNNEQHFHQAMAKVASWMISGKKLTLFAEDGEAVMILSAVYLPE